MKRSAVHRRCGPMLALAALMLAAGVSGCTVKHYTPYIVTVPTQHYSAVALGDIGILDHQYDYLVSLFRRGFVQTIKERQAFETVEDPAPVPVPESTLLLTGTITEVDEGNDALQWIVGMGAGKSIVKGTFALSDASGRPLLKFDAQESYAGGAGFGGMGVIEIEGLMRVFGGTVAMRTIQWSRGETLR